MKRDSLYIVMTKEILINLRVRPEVRDEFKKVAELRGSTVSGLLHQYMVKTIREEKDREPQAFEKPENNPPKYTEEIVEHGSIGKNGELKPGSIKNITDFLNKNEEDDDEK